MPRLSPVDAVGPALQRTQNMLFPFRLATWLKFGFISWLGGGLAVASFNLNSRVPALPSQLPSGSGEDPWHGLNDVIRSIHIGEIAGILAVALVIGAVVFVFSLIFLYFFSRFRFILFDSVISGKPVIARGWDGYRDQAQRYFGAWVIFSVIGWAATVFIVGMPIWRAYKSGVFQGDSPALAFFELLASIGLGLLAYTLVVGIISTLLNDFIMPLLALDDMPLGAAWRTLWRFIAAEPGAWAGYLGMKLVLAILASVALGITSILVFLISLLVLAIPVGLLILLGAFAFKIAVVGPAVGVIVFVLTGVAVLAFYFCVFLIVPAPFGLFFASYAFYFFGGRYGKLGDLLWPQTPPQTTPPQMASPVPAGS